MNDLIGRTLGQYQIVEQIGAGGMATVYKAHQPSLKRDVALKVLAPFHAKQPGFSERFQREAQAVANLHHPNILPVYDFGQEGEYSFIAMRYVEGARTLKEVLETPCHLGQAADLIGQIAAALDHAHQRGVIHRDVKPRNVLMDGDWALLADFGIAKITEASVKLTGTGVGIGTPAYMSPEQGQGLPVDHRTDIYSLGVILFEILTGQIPHDAETPFGIVIKRMSEPLPLPSTLNPRIPHTVERVILKGLAADPGERFQTAGEMARALTRSVGTVPTLHAVSSTAPTMPDQTALPADVNRKAAVPARRGIPLWAWGAVGCVALLLAVGLLMALRGGGGKSPAVIVRTTETAQPAATVTLSASDTPVSTATEEPATVTPSRTARPTGTAIINPSPSPTVESPPTSSDGFIAYAAGPSGAWQIFIADPASGETWPLPGQPSNSGVPNWSPGGDQLAFRSNASGAWQIYAISREGGGLRQLTSSEGDNLEPAWSPDGTRIAFVSERDGNKEIYLMDSDGANQRRLTDNPGWDDDPSWSPDGRWLVFESRRGERMDIFKMRADGSEVVRLTSDGELNSTPAWSPDGRSIAFERRSGAIYHIWIMSADGSDPRQLTSDGGQNLRPAWSPDSSAIAYTSDRGRGDAVWIIPVEGGQAPRRLSPGQGFDPAWLRP